MSIIQRGSTSARPPMNSTARMRPSRLGTAIPASRSPVSVLRATAVSRSAPSRVVSWNRQPEPLGPRLNRVGRDGRPVDRRWAGDGMSRTRFRCLAHPHQPSRWAIEAWSCSRWFPLQPSPRPAGRTDGPRGHVRSARRPARDSRRPPPQTPVRPARSRGEAGRPIRPGRTRGTAPARGRGQKR